MGSILHEGKVVRAEKLAMVREQDISAIAIDLSEYYLKDVNKILGILASGINC